MSKTKKSLKPREPMAPLDVDAALLLNIVRKKLGSPDHKMFVYRVARRAETHPERGMTVAQRWWLWDLVWKYRLLIVNRVGRDDDLWKVYQRVRDAAFEMHRSSRLRWAVRDLRRAPEPVEVPESSLF